MRLGGALTSRITATAYPEYPSSSYSNPKAFGLRFQGDLSSLPTHTQLALAWVGGIFERVGTFSSVRRKRKHFGAFRIIPLHREDYPYERSMARRWHFIDFDSWEDILSWAHKRLAGFATTGEFVLRIS